MHSPVLFTTTPCHHSRHFPPPRHLQSYIIHKLLNDEAAAKWTTKFAAGVERRVAANLRRRSGRVPPAQAKKEAKEAELRHLGPKPTPLTHLEFRLAIVRHFLGLGQYSEKLRVRGGPGFRSKGQAAQRKEIATTPHAKRQKLAGVKERTFSTPGGEEEEDTTRLYPKYRARRDTGDLGDPKIRCTDAMKKHPPVVHPGVARGKYNNHRCQVCAQMGRVHGGAVGQPKTYRNGGKTHPGKATITCLDEGCPSNFCGPTCWTHWHHGYEPS